MQAKHISGFSLIELLIVVAIIGILAAIAIPNFMKYQAKSKQSEAKINLKGLFTAETAYFAERATFSPHFSDINWIPVGPCKYAYNAGGANAGLNLPLSLARNNAQPGAGATSFTAVAWGSISNNPNDDTWQITASTPLTNVFDAVNN